MSNFLALLAFLTTAGVNPEHVRIPGPGGLTLDAALVRPAAPTAGHPAVVALHGCGGPNAKRDGTWATLLSQQGHVVLLPDSFGSRGLGSQCRVRDRTVTPGRDRRQDAIVAARWLSIQPGTPAGGIVMAGWSNGGSTVLAVARQADDLPTGLISRYVAFYPGCATPSRDATWRPAAPILILIGLADDWTPAPPCRHIANKFPAQITFVGYPDAYHDFDAPDVPVRVVHGLATTRDGTAHVGTNPAARQDALLRVPRYIDTGK